MYWMNVLVVHMRKKPLFMQKMHFMIHTVRSIRWASDRIGTSGIIALVTNGSFIKSETASGIRASLENEFDYIWCYDLRGNARTQGDLRRSEGGNIFDSGSRAPVAIILFGENDKK